jgi:hypothetical protein
MLTFCITLAATLIAGASASSGQAMPLPASPSQRLELFETCAGRLSAMVEHQWLVDPAASDETEALRNQFDMVIDAVLPDALDWGTPPEMAMHWRITAKVAQAQLLSTATFGTDPARAARARAIARARTAECGGILIG